MIKIGSVTLKNNVFLAPMAGVTDLSFRILCSRFGAGLSYTEMVSAKALSFNDKKTHSLMETYSIPTAVQIFGSLPDTIASVIPLAEEHGLFTDINMGCPAPKIAGNGEGAALMKDPALVGKIVSAACKAAKKPVTVKIRSGWDTQHINAVLIAETACECGAAAITVHGRTREQFYSGKADRSVIKEVCRAVPVPVIANGDIFCAEDAVSMLEETGADAVMVGRGAQGNPWIFAQINELIEKGRVLTHPTREERIETAIEHMEMLCRFKGEYIGIREARKHMSWYIKGMKGAAGLRNMINNAVSCEEMRSIMMRLL